MSKVTRLEWYERVNAAWPEIMPTMPADEQVAIARRMYRFVMGETWTGPVILTSGNRYTWIRRGTLYVNPEQPINGRRGLVHLLSHYFDNRLNRDTAPHASSHARLELRMVKEIVKRGYLSGSLRKIEKPVQSKTDQKLVKYGHILASIERWERKQKRTENALKKLRRQAKYYERNSKTEKLATTTVH